jgi:hypothetical protein
LLDLRPAGSDSADHFAADLHREAAGHVGEIANAHRHRQRVLFRA